MRKFLVLVLFTAACKVGLAPNDDAALPEDPDAAPPEVDAAPGAPDASIDAADGTLTVVVEGPGGGVVVSSPAGIDCGTACSAMFTPGTPVSITAMPDSVSRFTAWSGDCSGSSGTCPLIMDGPRTATATFERLPVPVTVTVDGDGDGVVTSTPGGISCGGDCSDAYAYLSTVVLGAAADAGSAFEGWGGDCAGTGPCVLTMDGAKSVTATFRATCEAAPYLLATPGVSTVTVPVGCHAATVKAWGAAGGGHPYGSMYSGGGGGFATAKVVISPGESLQVAVGGGGAQAPGSYKGAGGGGSSGLVRGVTPLLVAGGGGGAGSHGVGGGGGGTSGVDGGFPPALTVANSGKGGTQTSPGAGGAAYWYGAAGASGTGANGGAGGTNNSTMTGGAGAGGTGWGLGGAGGNYLGGYGGGGGGGGGGYFGAGGGGGTGDGWNHGSGGGGGSSYVDYVTNTAKTTTAASGPTPGNTGDPDYSTGVGVAGTGAGGNGRLVIIWLDE